VMQLAGFEEQEDPAIDRQIEINLRAVIHGTRAAARLMGPRGGHIVNIASAAGKFGFPGGAAYCATKHGVVGFSEAVRLELRGSGIEVSCVMPAVVRTELAAGLGEARLIRSVTAEQVADAIVHALRFPRFDVFVPRNLAAMYRLMSVLPRGSAEWLLHALGGDRILSDAVGSAARARYELRASASAPAAQSEQKG
ncbi:MAG: SDR family NAD(P)-dependent oxidoreductase, partial [Sciscionella sp.]